MFEILLIIAASIGMGRFGEADRGEGTKWAAITFGLGLASLLIPLPFLRVLLACGLSFVLMTVTKKTYY